MIMLWLMKLSVKLSVGGNNILIMDHHRDLQLTFVIVTFLKLLEIFSSRSLLRQDCQIRGLGVIAHSLLGSFSTCGNASPSLDNVATES